MDVAGRQFDRRLDRIVGVLDLVEILEIGLQPLHDVDGVGNRRLDHVDLLEAAHQRAVLFEELAVFLVGRRADAADGARRKRRLQQVGGIHRPAGGGAGTDHRVDLVDEHDRAGGLLDLLDDLLEALLEVTAIAGSGQQRAHVEGEDRAFAQHFGHVALDDALGKAFGNRRLADAGIADIERVVLRAAAEHLDGAVDLGGTADQRIDLAGFRLFVEVYTIGRQGIALLLGIVLANGRVFVLDAAHDARLRSAGALGDAVGDVVDGVVARHLLLLQEIGRMAFALGKDGNQHVGAAHLLAARRLYVDHRALDHPVETGRRLGVLVEIGHQIGEFVVDIVDKRVAQAVEIDVAGAHDGDRVLVLGQRQQQVLKRRIFLVAFVGQGQRRVKHFFKAFGKRRQWLLRSSSLHPVYMGIEVPCTNPPKHITPPKFCPALFLLHHALQRVLVLAGEVHYLGYLGFGDLIGIDTAFADSVIMHMQHDLRGLLGAFAKKALQNMHDELHRGEVVVEQQHTIEVRLLDLGRRLGGKAGARALVVRAAFSGLHDRHNGGLVRPRGASRDHCARDRCAIAGSCVRRCVDGSFHFFLHLAPRLPAPFVRLPPAPCLADRNRAHRGTDQTVTDSKIMIACSTRQCA